VVARISHRKKQQHPPGEEVRRVSFLVTGYREEEKAGLIRRSLGGGRPDEIPMN